MWKMWKQIRKCGKNENSLWQNGEMKQKLAGEKKTEKPLAKMDEWNIKTKKNTETSWKVEKWSINLQKKVPLKMGYTDIPIYPKNCRLNGEDDDDQIGIGGPYFQTNPETEQVAGSSGKIIFQFPGAVGISWGFHVTFQGWNSRGEIHICWESHRSLTTTGGKLRRGIRSWEGGASDWAKSPGSICRVYQSLPGMVGWPPEMGIQPTKNRDEFDIDWEISLHFEGLKSPFFLWLKHHENCWWFIAVNLPQWTFCV